MSAVPLIQTRQERRYWIDEQSLQTLLDLMFSYISGDRANGAEEHLGWTISWETRYDSRLYVRGGTSGEEYELQPAGYTARIIAPGLVYDANIDRIVDYLEQQGLPAVAYEEAATSFEFAIGA